MIEVNEYVLIAPTVTFRVWREVIIGLLGRRFRRTSGHVMEETSPKVVEGLLFDVMFCFEAFGVVPSACPL